MSEECELNGITYNLIWDPNKRLFLPVVVIDHDQELRFPRRISHYPTPFQQLQEEQTTKTISAISNYVVRLLFNYWDLTTAEQMTTKAIASGVAVGPRHVLTLAHFSEFGLPTSVTVIKDNYAPLLPSPKVFKTGTVTAPTSYNRTSPVIIVLEEDFFDTWLQPSFNQPTGSIFVVGYNSVPLDEDLKQHFINLEKKSLTEETNYLNACPPWCPTTSLAVQVISPDWKAVSPGVVLGYSPSGTTYVSATVAPGSSGGPVFSYPPSMTHFDGIIFGGSSDLNANLVISTSTQHFKDAWKELTTNLNL